MDIKKTSIEQLMQISVTTVSRQARELQTSAAAVYVLTKEEIRNAHVTSIPEALALVPGVQVAQIDANKWAVSIRGFTSRTANKLLVLIDGRSIYDPLFAGVFWESHQVSLINIERIEVVRGPGGALWGANAVNGVINIITQHAADTQGMLAVIEAGDKIATADVHNGWQLRPGAHARVYANWQSRDTGYSVLPASDDSHASRVGFRVDMDMSDNNKLMFKGDVYDGTYGERLAAGGSQDVLHQGGNIVARWTRDQVDGSHSMLQFWYDRLRLDNINLGEERDTFDIEFENGLRMGQRQRLLWGLGYRQTQDDIRNGLLLGVIPSSRRDKLPSAFLQHESDFADRTLNLIIGAKVERNSYSGTEWQPSLRISWTPDTEKTWWASASRAVRSPSRLESDLTSPGVTGNPEFQSEQLLSYELGHRRSLGAHVWLDVATFYNIYDDLMSIEGTVIDNRLDGTTTGLEIAARWQPVDRWQFNLAYTCLNMDITPEPGSADISRAARIEGSDPHHQVALRTSWTPRTKLRIDAALRYTDSLPALNVPSYLVSDVAATWALRPGIDLSLILRDLFDNHHPEQSGITATEVPRSFSLKLRWAH